MVIHTFFNRVFTITQVFPVHKLTQTKSTISGCAGLGVSRISSYLFHLYKLVKINNKQMLIISTNIYIYPLSWSLSHKNKITHDCSSQKYPNQKKHFSIYDIYMVQYLLMYYSIV